MENFSGSFINIFPGTLIMLMILLSGAAFLALCFKRKIEDTLGLWVLSIIVIIYVFGLAGNLKLGVFFILPVSAASFIYVIYSTIRRKENIKFIASPGTFIYIFIFFLIWWAHRGRMLTEWDSFSHWGLVVKNMYIFNAFGNHPEATTIFRGYPPGTAIFQYFWAKVSGTFYEGNLYRAINVICFSLMMPVFKNIRSFNRKNITRLLGGLLMIVVVPVIFYSNFYCDILVDATLGIMFAFVLITHYTGEPGAFSIINISLGLFVLTLTKASGAGLSAIALIIIYTDMLLFKRNDIKNLVTGKTKPATLAKASIYFLPVLFTLFSKYSWSLYLKATNTKAAWNTGAISLKNIIGLITGKTESYRIQTVRNFLRALTGTNLTDHTLGLSFGSWIIVLLTFSIILCKYVTGEKEKNRYKFMSISITAGALIYALSLMLLYAFTYSAYEATKLASYNRYMNTYLLGAVLVIVSLIFMLEKTGQKILKISFFNAILLFLLFITPLSSLSELTILARFNVRETIACRSEYEPIKKVNKLLNPETDKIYFVAIGDTGFSYHVCRFNLTPVKTNPNFSWSIGTEKCFNGDVWTRIISSEKWSEELKKDYTHVYIFKTNEKFKNDFGSLFKGGPDAVKNNTLYKVEVVHGKVILTEEIC